MRLHSLALVLALTACGHPPAPPATATATPPRTATPAPVTQPTASAASEDVDESACAFPSLDALCQGFREHHLSSGSGWVSEGCGYGARRRSSGTFAETLIVAVHVGHESSPGGERVERPLLESTVREPASTEPGTNNVLVTRVGARWFPLWVFSGESTGPHFVWRVDEAGEHVEWTVTEGDPASSPYGQIERTLVASHHGVPLIVAMATLDRWREESDPACVRGCGSRRGRARFTCEQACATRLRTTRTWTATEHTIELGAGQTVGGPASSPEEEASARSLDDPSGWMALCGFSPVVHAVPSASSDPESTAARERARAVLANGTWREVPGARRNVAADAATSVVEILGTEGTSCGGGGCTVGIRTRTIDGAMPEQGIHYFYSDRGETTGCDPHVMPEQGVTTLVEVAPASPREGVSCGFGGYDGTAARTWVVVRVFTPAR